MAAASQRPVAGKLGVKAGNRVAVLHSPKGYTAVLAKFPANVNLTTRLAGEPFDLVQAFYEDQKSLKADLPKLRKAIHPLGKIWVCWRKGQVTDLSRESIWKLGEKVGLDSVASCAIDDNWSAMKLMLPKAERTKPKAKAASKRQSLYSEHPAVAMEAKAIAGLKNKTGKTMEKWILLLKKSGFQSTSEMAQWLKTKHGLGTNYSKWIAERAANKAASSSLQNYDPDTLVEKMFFGPKEALRPIYDAIIEMALRLGKDVKVTPCATIVPIRRRYVFAEIKPSTKTRIDLGFALKDTPASGRLIATGGRAKGDRITHRIPITSIADVDGAVKHWLKVAYDLDA